jgi:hypothetical protein
MRYVLCAITLKTYLTWLRLLRKIAIVTSTDK